MYIIATSPYIFSWTSSGLCSNDTADKIWKDENNKLFIRDIDDSLLYLYINDLDEVSFVHMSESEIRDNKSPSVNYNYNYTYTDKSNSNSVTKIRIGNKYIRHYASRLYLHEDNGTKLYNADSNWILFDNFALRDTEIVVARYKEDIRWLRFFTCKVYLYNKGPDIEHKLNDNIYVEKLSNVGRESHTYLYHIIKKYESEKAFMINTDRCYAGNDAGDVRNDAGDVRNDAGALFSNRLIFLQGDPFPHSPRILELLCRSYTSEFKGLSMWYSPTWPPAVITNAFMYNGETTDYILDEELYYANFKNKFYLVKGDKNIKLQITNFISKYGISKTWKGYSVILAALFSVSKQAILHNDIFMYKNLLIASMGDVVNGYILELLWPTIFNAAPCNEMRGVARK
jgi:hypothetical protein